MELKRKPGRPKGAVQNKAIKDAMKRKFGRVITPQKFGALVELIYDQAVGKEEVDGKKVPPCKASQKLIFEYAMIKPANEVDGVQGNSQIVINIGDMEPVKTFSDPIEGEVIDADS